MLRWSTCLLYTSAPYGYVKDPDNKDFWVIDEEAAKYQEKEPEVKEPAETEKPKEPEPAPEEQKTESEQKKASPLPMIMRCV